MKILIKLTYLNKRGDTEKIIGNYKLLNIKAPEFLEAPRTCIKI